MLHRYLGTLLPVLLFAHGLTAPAAHANNDLWNKLQSGGYVLLMRHASTDPGLGDPPEFRLGDCATQRNLSAAGRDEARRSGRQFAERGIAISAVLSSRWCRSLDTAQLAFGTATPYPPLDSFFAKTAGSEKQTAATIARIRGFRGPGNLALVTHQVNITALTGQYPAQGEIFVVRSNVQGKLELVYRILPPAP